jgi:hypothetical protein
MLIGAAIGAGLSSMAYVAVDHFRASQQRPSAMMSVFALIYHKPKLPLPSIYTGIPDPLTGVPSDAIVELATRCRVEGYALEYVEGGPFSAVPTAALYIHPAKLSDEAFDCLSEQVRPPYLTLIKTQRCRRLMERDPTAPSCPQVIH